MSSPAASAFPPTIASDRCGSVGVRLEAGKQPLLRGPEQPPFHLVGTDRHGRVLVDLDGPAAGGGEIGQLAGQLIGQRQGEIRAAPVRPGRRGAAGRVCTDPADTA